jgi:hypothetical protein
MTSGAALRRFDYSGPGVEIIARETAAEPARSADRGVIRVLTLEVKSCRTLSSRTQLAGSILISMLA